ncbi:MAG: tetratricopeptide repeat protein, partial [Chloroflexia bacterium]|nr:tetratricopeptide repeat protein [Chloroflexia bacterium]
LPTVQYLSAAATFCITRPEAASRFERWNRTFCAITRYANEPVAAGWGFFSLGRWYLLANRHAQAIEVLQVAEAIGREQAAVNLIGYAIVERATSYRLSGANEQALHSLDAALDLVEGADGADRNLIVTILVALGVLYLTIAQPNAARPHIERASELLAADTEPEPYLELFIAQLSALLMLNQSQPGDALKQIQRAHELATRLQDERLLADLEALTGWAHFQHAEPDASRQWYARAQQRVDALPYPRLQPQLWLYEAELYSAKGEHQAAQDLLVKALATIQHPEHIDRNLEAQIRTKLGGTYYRRGQMKSALEMLQSAIELLEAVHNTQTAVEVLNLIGIIYRESKQIEAGLAYFQQKQEQIQNLKNDGAQITLFNWLAILLNDIGNVRDAMGYFERATPLVELLENNEERATTYMLFASIYR